MKSKMILSVVMAAAITLSGAAMATNANFNAQAASIGNTVTMGTVQLQNATNGVTGQNISMDTLFNVSNLGTLTDPVENTAKIVIQGSLPVTLSLGKYDDKLLYQIGDGPDGVVANWANYYKSNVVITVKKLANSTTQRYASNCDTDNDGFTSIFDTIAGNGSNSINTLLAKLGSLHHGDVVTITTKTKFDQACLTQDQVNAFQGTFLSVNLKLVATEAKY